MSTSDSSASPPGALIVPDLVRLDVPVGPDKKDVIEYLADVVASAGRADTPEGLAADALAREATAPPASPGASPSRTAAVPTSWRPPSGSRA